MAVLPGKGRYFQTGAFDLIPFTAIPFVSNLVVNGLQRLPLAGNPLSRRKSITFQNLSGINSLFIGFTNSVVPTIPFVADSGFELGPDKEFTFDWGDQVVIWLTSAAAINIQVMENR